MAEAHTAQCPVALPQAVLNRLLSPSSSAHPILLTRVLSLRLCCSAHAHAPVFRTAHWSVSLRGADKKQPPSPYRVIGCMYLLRAPAGRTRGESFEIRQRRSGRKNCTKACGVLGRTRMTRTCMAKPMAMSAAHLLYSSPQQLEVQFLAERPAEAAS